MSNWIAKTKMIDTDFVKNGASSITQEDVRSLLVRVQAILKKVKASGVLKGLLDDVMLMFCMVKDYCNGCYREVPFCTVAAVVFSLLYIFWSADLIPDVIPIVGYLDEAMVVTICIKLGRKDLERYRRWKKIRSTKDKPAPAT